MVDALHLVRETAVLKWDNTVVWWTSFRYISTLLPEAYPDEKSVVDGQFVLWFQVNTTRFATLLNGS